MGIVSTYDRNRLTKYEYEYVHHVELSLEKLIYCL